MHTRRIPADVPLHPALLPAVLHRTSDAVWLNVGHPAYDAALLARPVAPVVALPPTVPDGTRRTLDALARVPWPHRGALLWQLLRHHKAPSAALLAAVRPLISDGGCGCRSHFDNHLRQRPPDYGAGWRRWVYDFQQAVEGRRGRPGIDWAEAERRHAIADTLAGCTVITLERTQGRRDRFYRDWPRDWPYALPEPLYGTDGQAVEPAAFWDKGNHGGRGGWGARCSWLSGLDLYLARTDAGETRPWLFMEDDCDWDAGAADRLPAFLAAVPDDADLAFPGAQHLSGTPQPVAAGVVRSMGVHRMHAIVVYARYARQLRDEWAAYPKILDYHLNAASPSRRFYVADPILCGQSGGYSEIAGRDEGPRTWGQSLAVTPDHRTERLGIAHPLACGGVKRYADVGELNAFNGATIETPHGRLCIHRSKGGYELRWMYLGDDLRPRQDRPRGTLTLVNNDDPRLIYHDGRLLMSTDYWWSRAYNTQMELRELTLSADGTPAHRDLAKFTDKSPPLWDGYAKGAQEKNWAPFSHDGRLYYVYSFAPHRILAVDLDAGTARLSHETPVPALPAWVTAFRLSAPPVRLADGSYLSMLHTKREGESGVGYYHGFYRFRGEPPFDVLSVSAEPVLLPTDSADNCWRQGPKWSLLFVQGMELAGDIVQLWGGDNDHSVVRMDVPLAVAVGSMAEVGK